MTPTGCAPSETSRPALRLRPAGWRRPLDWIATALAISRSRRSLRAIDAHLLRDIGLTREAAEREALRPLWDAPDWWHK